MRGLETQFLMMFVMPDVVDEPHVVEVPVEAPETETPVAVQPLSEAPVVTSRRSGRQLSKPAWMQSGEYDMEM